VDCSPQAWAAASIFSLLSSCLGMSINALSNEITFLHPYLPGNLQTITIQNLTIGEAVIDFAVTRQNEDVSIHVIKRSGAISVLIQK
jgi:glycogen debranching enzyme